MQKIIAHIEFLLTTADRVTVPSFGTFYKQYTPSEINPVQFTHSPPASLLMFDSSEKDDDGVFFNTFAKKQQTNYQTAATTTATEVAELIEKMENNTAVVFGNLGTFRYSIEKEILFTANEKNNYLKNTFGLPIITAMPVMHRKIVLTDEKIAADATIVPQQKTESPKLNFNWNIAAVVLFFLGIMAVLQLMQSDFHPASLRLNTASVAGFFDKYYVGENNTPLKVEAFLPIKKQPEAIASEPIQAIETVAEKNEIKEAPIEKSPTNTQQTISKKYYIVMGQFGVKKNANSFAEKLAKTNHTDVIIRKNPANNLLLVGYAVADNEEKANVALAIAKKTEAAAWIYSE